HLRPGQHHTRKTHRHEYNEYPDANGGVQLAMKPQTFGGAAYAESIFPLAALRPPQDQPRQAQDTHRHAQPTHDIRTAIAPHQEIAVQLMGEGENGGQRRSARAEHSSADRVDKNLSP